MQSIGHGPGWGATDERDARPAFPCDQRRAHGQAPRSSRVRAAFAWLTTGRTLCSLLLALLALGLPACGYTHQDLYATEYRTVAVPIFANRTFYRGVEFDLTEALAKEIELRTPYKVADQSTSDTILQGTIIAVEQIRASVRREGGLPQEMETRIVVNYEWITRQGQVLRREQGLRQVGRYVPARPAGETFELSQHDAVQRLASRIVGAMRSNW